MAVPPSRHGVDVYADLDRQLPVLNSTGRELLLSVGAAMFNLRVALRAHGRVPVQLLRPTPHVSGADGPAREVLADLTRAAGTECGTLRMLERDARRSVLGALGRRLRPGLEGLAAHLTVARPRGAALPSP